MTISDLLNLYLSSHSMSKDSASVVRRSMRYCIEVFGDCDIATIKEVDVVRLKQLLDATGKPSRAMLACKWLKILLCEAWRLRLLTDYPRLWPKFRRVRDLPDSWTEEEAARLLGVASAMPGSLCGVPAGVWFRAWLLVAWDTALRASQMFRLLWQDVSGDFRTLVVRPVAGTKSYRPQVKALSAQGQAALRDLAEFGREREVFPFPEWPRSRREFFSLFRMLCHLAEIPAPRDGRLQLTHKLRRSSITAVARLSLEAAQRHAGHASLRTTLDHYIDPRRLNEDDPPVPPLRPPLRVVRD